MQGNATAFGSTTIGGRAYSHDVVNQLSEVTSPAARGEAPAMKTMLVPYHEDEAAARAALAIAVLLAKRFQSYVEGLLVVGEPILVPVPGMVVPGEYLTAAAEEWRRFADRARCEFAALTRTNSLPMQEVETPAEGPAAGWREMQGNEAEMVGQHGRLFDLIVVARPERGPSRRWREIREAALFETGRPVLLAPVLTDTDAPPATLGRNIVIAWNGSTETARTIAFGMPFLRAADRVEVLTVEGHTVAGPNGCEVTGHLARHGIAATSRTLQTGGRPAGEVILAEAGDVGADLVLKGAFTRSRFRQVVFGGTTQHILDHARIPVLLAH